MLIVFQKFRILKYPDHS